MQLEFHFGNKIEDAINNIKIFAESKGGDCFADGYVNEHTKLKWKCSKGHRWEASFGQVKKGKWCPSCAKNAKLSTKNMQQLAHFRQGKNSSSKILSAKGIEKYIQKGSKTKYKLDGLVAEGGMGFIFSAIEQTLQRQVAMKVLLPELRKNKEILQNFITEARIMACLEHPNIITLYEFDRHNELGIFFTMKKVEGETLDDIIEKLREEDSVYIEKYNILQLLKIFCKVCDAISYAHSKKILHLDIKPENIIVSECGEILLLDWGSAIVFDIEQETNSLHKEFLTKILAYLEDKKLTIVGSPGFMSPEQTQGEFSLLNQTTDIFLLGATLYNLLTLELPYDGEDIDEILNEAAMGNFTLPHLVNPKQKIPKGICHIITKAMSYEQEYRYQSVQDLVKDLEKWLFKKL